MKHLTTMLLAVGLSTLCATGQNVIVVMKDGSRHKFNADYVSELKFQDVAPETPPVEFKTVDVNPYSNGNVELTFADEAGTTECKLDLYGPTDAIWLHAGNYAFSDDMEPWTFSKSYSYVELEGTKHDITDGSTVITIENSVYTVEMNLVLDDGTAFKGKYTGALDKYTQEFNVTLSAAAYSSTAQPKGQFQIKFNDANWNYEMGIYFVSDHSASVLPAGEYIYSTTGIVGALLDISTIDDFVIHDNLKVAPGSKAGVSIDGDDYTFDMELHLTDGRIGHFTYTGPLTGTPEFIDTPAPEAVEFDSLKEDYWSNTNTTLTFKTSGDDVITLALDCYMDPAAYFTPGTYVVGGTTGLYIDTNDYYTFLIRDGEQIALESGTMVVTLDDETYTFDIDIMLENGEQFVGTYTGQLEFGPGIPDIELALATYSSTPRPYGNFYVKFNDVDWKCEMALDLFASPEATTLPAGTYTYSEENTPGTFGPHSYVDLFSPNSNNRMAEGSVVTVTETGENYYDIVMDLVFTDGRTMHLTFEGDIKGTPVFNGGEVETVTFDTVNVKPYGSFNSTIEFWNESDPTMKLSLDFYGRQDSEYFQPGTYTVGHGTEMYIEPDAQYSFLGNAASSVPVVGGTVEVTLDGEIYTFDMDLELGNESAYKAKYTGKLNKFGPELGGIELTLSAAAYNSNPRPAGNMYIKFNDADWNCEMAIDFFAEPSATTLPAGTYTYSEDKTPGTFGPNSYFDYYVNGSNNYRMADGSTIVVTRDGDDYTIEMNLVLNNGKTAHLTYSGTIGGTPVFEETPGPEAIVFDELYVNYYGSTNSTLEFSRSDDPNSLLSLDCYMPSAPYFPEGTFVVGASNGLYIDDSIYYTFLAVDGEKTGVTSGTMEVTLDGFVYTFDINIMLADGTNYVATYTGELNAFGPAKPLDVELSAAAYNVNARPAGNYYVKFNDSAWTVEMALDLYADPATTELPAGTYTYSTEKTPGTFSQISYLDYYVNGSTEYRMAEGSEVVVAKNGSDYTIEMNLKLVDGPDAHLTYSGTISGTPVFE